ncbi:DUF3515 domain-containing protein [Pseudonocardia sp. TRM90224]|uniref:DUF3515 domain-containing protein n=1 Tax=Pseudonocardia sp. TRM90224 TaxID=2812678 RepID=UPI001E3D9B88|nr:DUF3515 domain-containing protein [Pseudonocardia sp. TRM90224]
MNRPPAPVLVAISLPLLLAVVVGAIAVAARLGAFDVPEVAETSPLAVAPVDAPGATGPECTALLTALPEQLDAPDGPMPPRPLADPVQPGVRAWAAAPRPAVLRCGLPRPAELTPVAQLLVVNGVQWLKLDDGLPDPVVVTYVAVDRPTYVAFTTPVAAGITPVQHISDVVGATLPAVPVAVR